MKRTLIAIAVAACLPAAAQVHSPERHAEQAFVFLGHELLADAASAKATAEAWRHWGDDLRASLGTMYGDRLGSSRTVKGAPYSADVVTESNQSLADGNVISKRTTGRVYRDGEGRTRQETVVNGEPKSIQLRDPVEGSSVMLLPGSKKAVRMPAMWMSKDGHHAKELKVLRLGEKEVRIEDGKASVDGKEATGKVEFKAGGKEIRIENGKVWIDGKEVAAGAGGPKFVVKHLDSAETGDGTRREEIRVHVVRSGDGKEATVALPPMPPLPAMGAFPHRLDGALAKSKGTTTALGTKEFDGVKAEGKSTVHTIAAGEIGNRNAILVTSESWYSPELQVTVYSRQIDPRYGETTYRLGNIRRGEPAADLFKVPEEYEASRRTRG